MGKWLLNSQLAPKKLDFNSVMYSRLHLRSGRVWILSEGIKAFLTHTEPNTTIVHHNKYYWQLISEKAYT